MKHKDLRPWLSVIAGGESLVSHAGGALLVEAARRSGLAEELSGHLTTTAEAHHEDCDHSAQGHPQPGLVLALLPARLVDMPRAAWLSHEALGLLHRVSEDPTCGLLQRNDRPCTDRNVEEVDRSMGYRLRETLKPFGRRDAPEGRPCSP